MTQGVGEKRADDSFGRSKAVMRSPVIGFVICLVVSSRFSVPLRHLWAPFWGAPGVVFKILMAGLRVGGALSLFLSCSLFFDCSFGFSPAFFVFVGRFISLSNFPC